MGGSGAQRDPGPGPGPHPGAGHPGRRGDQAVRHGQRHPHPAGVRRRRHGTPGLGLQGGRAHRGRDPWPRAGPHPTPEPQDRGHQHVDPRRGRRDALHGFPGRDKQHHRAAPRGAADPDFFGHHPGRDPEHGGQAPHRSRAAAAVRGLHRGARDTAPVLHGHGRRPAQGPAPRAGVREPRAGVDLLQHPGRHGLRGLRAAKGRLQGGGHQQRPEPGRAGARHGAYAPGRPPVPGGHRGCGPRHRPVRSEPRHQLHLPRVRGHVRTPHRPHRPRGQVGRGHLAGLTPGDRQLLLPQADPQDPPRGAPPALPRGARGGTGGEALRDPHGQVRGRGAQRGDAQPGAACGLHPRRRARAGHGPGPGVG